MTVFKLIIEPKLDSKTAKTYQEKRKKEIRNKGTRIKREKAIIEEKRKKKINF